MRKTLAIIPARGGSKRLPRKNIRSLYGRPMIEWTIKAAIEAKSIREVVVSTDDPEIAACSKAAGAAVPFLRPVSLATDLASTEDVLRHALSLIRGYSHFVLLQPTSPLRTGHDIDRAFSIMLEKGGTSCVSVAPMKETPQMVFSLDDSGVLKRFGSEDMLKDRLFRLNGAIYISEVGAYERTGALIRSDTIGYVMPKQRSIDIDTEEEFVSAETMFSSSFGNG